MGPPCAKCRREQRECVFSETRAWERKKKRASQSDIPSSANTRRRLSSSVRSNDGEPEIRRHDPASAGNVDGHSEASITPHRPTGESSHARQKPASTLESSMMRTVVSSGNDALNILFEAAAHSQEADLAEARMNSGDITDQAAQGVNNESPFSQIHSAVSSGGLAKSIRPVEISQASKDVLSTWETCRFVMMGWFTPREAVTLVDLFYKNMSSLSPILTDFYADHQNHRELITCDPVLCCTILMLSSRYHILPGPGGESRNFFIHHRLWQHCQQLVTRLMFGQERTSNSKLRRIGTIEALLLMSEWHPRSLHFPPESDGWDFDLVIKPPQPRDEEGSTRNRLLEDMVEPAKRSDQMSWMLLGAALSLSHELEIYEVNDDKRSWLSAYEGCIPGDQIKLRQQRVQRLLYVYINQLAWRIGCVSLMPQSLNHTILNRQTSRNLKHYNDQWLAFMDSWMDLTKLAKSVTDMFFPSAEFARQQLRSGRYIDMLDHFRPLLLKWEEEHLRPEVLNKRFYNDLFIEYHFVRAYTHSIGMQAVVERVIADSNPDVEIRAANIDQVDYEYIQEVIDGCCQVLQKASELGEAGALRFCPVRIFLRITTSSIFLMKALSIGTRHAKLRESLDTIERCIQALKSNALDDIHLSARYAALLETHVSRLRRNLLASKITRGAHGCTAHFSLAPLQDTDTEDSTPMGVPAGQTIPELGFIPTFNDLAADDWLSLPFDPSMAPFGMSGGGPFPAYEGGALNFIWNLPS
ncbi:putative C6 transcription factor [Aspergillus mulundensis]|uniref:Putative Zn(II)2Cys6 transcription factor n=1 Tax=Aspergillus mulundensis TaxID=1810919 RepID=A0A3D8S4E0_9EURO|nr:putative Zn(II)2Cys6 transcription factor [Aspergillus mulundensis]RDW81177.1 putative Zn(II)2Cys6 transcription factor [Aspergillus mulundensis]